MDPRINQSRQVVRESMEKKGGNKPPPLNTQADNCTPVAE